MAYALGDILLRTIMENDTGLPEDRVVNDFAFATGATAPTQAEIDDCIAHVDDFFRVASGTAVNAVGEYIADTIDRGATHLIEVYSITAAGLGSPIYTENWLGPPAVLTTTNLPNEVAGVLSFHADLTGVPEEAPGGTRPRARRRGRVYIGPLNSAAGNLAQPNPVLWPQFRLDMQAAGSQLKSASTADGVPWSVWSRADEILRPVVGGWTDNAFDTQRRRGNAATARSTWT